MATTLPTPIAAGCGLFVAGLGLSSPVPAAVPLRRRLVHGSHSGMAAFSSGARLGFLLASPVVGIVAESTSVAIAVLVVSGSAALAVAVTRLPHRPRRRRSVRTVTPSS